MKTAKHFIRRRTPREFVLPAQVRTALEQVFGMAVDHVRVIEHSRHWMLWNPWIAATTRPGRIHLRGAGAAFLEDPALVLEEYYHVLRQWQAGSMTRRRYLWQLLRCGYAGNRFEVEAKQFARECAPLYRACCEQFRASLSPGPQ